MTGLGVLAQITTPETSTGVAVAALAIVGAAVTALVKVMSSQSARGDAAQAEHIKTLVDTRTEATERAERAEARADQAERRADDATREAKECKVKIDNLTRYVEALLVHLEAKGLDPPRWPPNPL